MMRNYMAVLAILSMASVPAVAQTTAPASPSATQQTAPAKPQMVKKRVCEQVDEDPYSRLGNRKICKTIEVPASETGSAGGHQPAAPGSERGE